MRKNVFIAGASRGIGLEFVRQYAEGGWRVFAGCRNPKTAGELNALRSSVETIEPISLDVSDETSIAAAASHTATLTNNLDVLVYNAGCFAPGEEGLQNTKFDKMANVFAVNAIGAVSVTRAFGHLLKNSGEQSGKPARVYFLTSGAGLLKPDGGRPGGGYSYGASKAALHHFILQIAADLQEANVIACGMAPGFVLTDMTKESPSPPPLRPPESVAGMIATSEKWTLQDTGKFFSHKGEECDWFWKSASA